MLSLRDDHNRQIDEAKLRAKESEALKRLRTTIANKRLLSCDDLVGKTIDRVVSHFLYKCILITTEGQFFAHESGEYGYLQPTSLSMSEAAACKLFDEGDYADWLIAGDAVRKHTKQKCEDDLIAKAIRVCGIDKVKAAVAAKDTK